MARFNITFASSAMSFQLGLAEEAAFSIGFEVGMAPAKCIPYEGPYEITPGVKAKSLPTADRHMFRDVVIQQIPYFEIDNVQAGQTVIIGG